MTDKAENELVAIVARVAPAEVAALDSLARRYKVSRSWVAAEAVRQFIEAKAEPSLAALRPQQARAANG